VAGIRNGKGGDLTGNQALQGCILALMNGLSGDD
jgi:hypothetical protein